MAQYTAPPYPNPQLTSITTATAEIAAVAVDVAALETAVGTYEGAEDLATDVAAALVDVAALETAVGTYEGAEDLVTDVASALTQLGTAVTVSTETDVWAALTALETRIATLEGA